MIKKIISLAEVKKQRKRRRRQRQAISMTDGQQPLSIINIYIPPFSSCPNQYHTDFSQIFTEGLGDLLIMGAFNANHNAWHSCTDDAVAANWGVAHLSPLGSSSHSHLIETAASVRPSHFHQLQEGKLGIPPSGNWGMNYFGTSTWFLRKWPLPYHHGSSQVPHPSCVLQELHRCIAWWGQAPHQGEGPDPSNRSTQSFHSNSQWEDQHTHLPRRSWRRDLRGGELEPSNALHPFAVSSPPTVGEAAAVCFKPAYQIR